MKLLKSLLVLLIAAAAPARAADIDSIQKLLQGQFRLLSEDLGAALSYKPLSPAEPLGITGFDVGVSVTATRLRNLDILDLATSSGNVPTVLPVPTLRAHKGLPFDIDVGVMLSQVPGTNIQFFGGELKYALLAGGVAMPAVAVRGSFTKLNGVDQLKLDTKGLDISISKGFLMATPYAGVGRVWVSSTPNVVTPLGTLPLTGETFGLNKMFVGLNFNLMLLNLAVEADRTGEVTSVGLKAGLRF